MQRPSQSPLSLLTNSKDIYCPTTRQKWKEEMEFFIYRITHPTQLQVTPDHIMSNTVKTEELSVQTKSIQSTTGAPRAAAWEPQTPKILPSIQTTNKVCWRWLTLIRGRINQNTLPTRAFICVCVSYFAMIHTQNIRVLSRICYWLIDYRSLNQWIVPPDCSWYKPQTMNTF